MSSRQWHCLPVPPGKNHRRLAAPTLTNLRDLLFSSKACSNLSNIFKSKRFNLNLLHQMLVDKRKVFILRTMGHRYSNPHRHAPRRSLWDLFLWKTGRYDGPAPRLSPAADFTYPGLPSQFERQLPAALWIGHSTFLIELEGLSILTDPVWDTYCSPILFKTFKAARSADFPFLSSPHRLRAHQLTTTTIISTAKPSGP